MSLPSILIVADRRKLFAYLILPDGLPEIIERSDLEHDSPTSVPPVGVDGRDACHAIAGKIAEILNRYSPDSWALACPTRMSEEIVRCLTGDQRESLALIRETSAENVEVSNVCQLFDAGAKEYTAEKENC